LDEISNAAFEILPAMRAALLTLCCRGTNHFAQLALLAMTPVIIEQKRADYFPHNNPR
jgi:hypothetical protein